jgi:predicted HicB family RNase H-like nuclease
MAKASRKVKKPVFKAEEYSYTVAWSDEDNAFVARVTEFPSLAAHGRTREKALREVTEVVDAVLADLKSSLEDVPAPLGKRQFSGKLNVRMPRDLHRRLAAESAAQGVSLNNWINAKLSK